LQLQTAIGKGNFYFVLCNHQFAILLILKLMAQLPFSKVLAKNTVEQMQVADM
jgi:hypothetical protein